MTDTTQQTPLPTLRPGDSHMESLIEAAIQGHASTREAMRWLVRQLVPAAQPAEVTDEEIDYAVLQAVGFDGMGTQEMSQFDCRNIARAILALRPATAPNLACQSVQARLATQWGYVRPVQVPMTDEVKVTSYSEWRRGDVLRITREGCDIGPFSVGQLVRHDDEDGDNVPYCRSLDGHDYYALIHDQLEFVSREAPHGITAQAKKGTP